MPVTSMYLPIGRSPSDSNRFKANLHLYQPHNSTSREPSPANS